MFGAFSSYFSGSSKEEEKQYQSPTQDVLDSEWILLEEQSLDPMGSDTSDFCNLSDVSASESFHYLSSPCLSTPVMLSPIPSPSLSNIDFIPLTPPSTHLTPYSPSPSPPYQILLAKTVMYDFSVGDLSHYNNIPTHILYTNTHDTPFTKPYFDDILVVPSYSHMNTNLALGRKELSLIKMEQRAEKRAVSIAVAKHKKENKAKQFRRSNKVGRGGTSRRRAGHLGRRKC